MAAPFNNLRSKLNRAICAYLVGGGAGTVDDVLPHNSRKPKGYPNTTVRATISKPEPPLTGIRRITVHINIKGSASQDPNEPNPEAARIAFNARVAETYDVMMQSDDGQSLRATAKAITLAGRALAVPVDNTPGAAQAADNNSDMTDFTCQAVYDAGEGDGDADAEGCSWMEVLIFECICSPSNVD